MTQAERPPVTAVERLARQIRVEIQSKRLAHGARLPATKVLAKTYGVSAATISRAVGLLADEGLIIASPRSGRVVHNPNPADIEPDARPVVVFIGGYAGSGKTELGRMLGRQTHWPMFDKDSTTRSVVEAALTAVNRSPNDRESDFYLQTIRPAEYDALLMGMEENLECGTSCIVTAPFVTEFADSAWIQRTKSMVAGHGGTAHIVWVACDPDTMLRYIRKRSAARDARKLEDWPAWVAKLDLDFQPATDDYTVINNSANAAPLQQQADELLTKVTA